MKRILHFMLLAGASAAAAYAQPAITSGGVLNAASYALPGLPNSAIAQGSLFVVFGSGMGPAALQSSGLPLSTTFGGTSLTVTVNGTSTKPLIVYTSAGQLAAVMPSTTPVGTGTITVTYNGQTSAASAVTVATSSFGIFSVNSAGSGPGIITNVGYSTASLTGSANPGEVFIIWGTGLGPAVSGDESRGTGTVGTIAVKVYVGGNAVTVTGYARSSCCGGLDQIAFVVPTGLLGCHVPVAVQIGNVVSNYVSMPIASTGRVCSDPANTNVSQVLGQGSASTGSVALSRSALSITIPGFGTSVSTTDSGSAQFVKYTAAQYTTAQNPLEINTFGACTVYTFKGNGASYADPSPPVNLDAGPAITVSGAGGVKTLTKMNGFYSAMLGGGTSINIPGAPAAAPLYLNPGAYTISNGSGGTDVGPFTTTLNVPNALVWTNAAASTTITRANGQLVTWTGGDPAGDVYIIGFSTAGLSNALVGAEFVCVEKDSKGSFTIPAPVLLSLPATAAGSLSSTGFMGVEFSTTGTFTARGLDQGVVSATGQSLQSATFQ